MKKELLPYSIVREFRTLYEEKISSLKVSLNHKLQERGYECEQVHIECQQFHSQVEDQSELKIYELSTRLKNSTVVIKFDITKLDWSDLELSKKWVFKGRFDLQHDYKTGTLGQCLKHDEKYDLDSMSKTYDERERENQKKTISRFFVRKRSS